MCVCVSRLHWVNNMASADGLLSGAIVVLMIRCTHRQTDRQTDWQRSGVSGRKHLISKQLGFSLSLSATTHALIYTLALTLSFSLSHSLCIRSAAASSTNVSCHFCFACLVLLLAGDIDPICHAHLGRPPHLMYVISAKLHQMCACPKRHTSIY